MKINILILYIILSLAIPMSAEVGDTIIHKGVQYKITSQTEVSAIYYDSAFIIIPDSVTYGTQKYAVTDAINRYNSGSCALKHYDKIDLSAATNITIINELSSELISVDTLILPPNLKYFPSNISTCDSVTGDPIKESETLLPGIHRVYSTGKYNTGAINGSLSLLEADVSSHTNEVTGFRCWSYNPFLQKLILPNNIKVFSMLTCSRDYCLKEFAMPDSLKQIDASVFDEAAITSLKLGALVENIHSQFAQEWYKLERIDVDTSNTHFMCKDGVLYTKDQSTLFHFPYYWTGSEFHIPLGTKTIGDFAFAYLAAEYSMDQFPPRREAAPLKKLFFTPTLCELKPFVFFGSSITTYVGFHETQVHIIPSHCFCRSALESILLPETIREIGDRAFAETPNLRKLGAAVSQSIHTIGQEAFRDAWNLEEIDLFGCNALVEIPKSMCLHDSSLTYVGLPRNVQTIGDRAFEGCISLEKILCPAVDPIPVNPSVFAGVPKWKCVLSVPAGSVEKYKKANVWKDFYYIEAAPLYYIATDVTDTLTGWVMGGGLYQKGENATVVANPYEGYQFSTWSDGITTNPRLIHVTKDMSLVAEFVKSTEAVETPAFPASTNGKRIENGQVVIIRDDKTYNTLGTEIK